MIIIFKIGDIVTRNSYNNDILFRIVSINNNIVRLQGVNVRLSADSLISDLVKSESTEDDSEIIERNMAEMRPILLHLQPPTFPGILCLSIAQNPIEEKGNRRG